MHASAKSGDRRCQPLLDARPALFLLATAPKSIDVPPERAIERVRFGRRNSRLMKHENQNRLLAGLVPTLAQTLGQRRALNELTQAWKKVSFFTPRSRAYAGLLGAIVRLSGWRSSSFALASRVSAIARNSSWASRLYISSASLRACAAWARNCAIVS